MEPMPKIGKTAASLTLGIWGAALALLVLPMFIAGMPVTPAIWANVTTTVLLGILCSGLLYRLALRIRARSLLPRSVLMFGAMAIAAVALALADAWKDYWLMAWLEPGVPVHIAVRATANGLVYSLLLGVLCALYLILLDSVALREQAHALAEAREAASRAELAASQAEAAATNARLAALRYQLNPHFLFNTLNAISSMVVTNRPEAAEGMLTKLSDFLRGTLTARPEALIPLEDELASVANYLEIESLRLRDRLSVAVECPPELLDRPVPSFLLQPLVENAIKHGVTPTSRPVTVTIDVRDEGDGLRIEVRDDGGSAGSGAATAGFGLGLSNVRERLRTVYGAAARVETARLDPGYRVTLILPAGEGMNWRSAA